MDNPYMNYLTEAQVANDPYMNESNPLMDMLIDYYMQTKGQVIRRPGVDKNTPTMLQDGLTSMIFADKPPQGISGTVNKMRDTKGPIKANKPKKIASEREKIMKEIP
jgi:hypothetical protein